MVKADGYGLGMLQVVRALRSEEPWGWGVATAEEGLDLRAAGFLQPVILFSPLPPGDYETAVEQALTVTLSDLGGLEMLRRTAGRLGREATFHVEVDTGMGRAGFGDRDLEAARDDILEAVRGGLVWEGLFTHFHSADEPGGPGVLEQWRRLERALEKFPEGMRPPLVHAGNSAAAFRYPQIAADAVRPGIFLFGGAIGEDLPVPRPVASLRARVTLVREVEAGATLGYGATYRASGPERWATVGIGYGDGLPRALSNRGHAILHGRRVPIIGRISMDVTVVDISGIEGVRPGDPVTFIGGEGEGYIGVDEVAGELGTISYEILTGITQRVERVWSDG
jgi:alanine racemase